MIKIDGRDYNVSIIKVGLDIEFMYKFAERTEDYDLNYELGAVFYNQSLTFGVEGSNNQDYVDLIKTLQTKSNIDKGTTHEVEIWTPFGKLKFLMYPNKIKMDMYKERGTETWWSGTEVKFIAKTPAARW